MNTDEIRSAFLEFFAARGHAVHPSAPLVPEDDASLLFANAGMVPFKDRLAGRDRSGSPRAASCQLCLRAGDLENVGRTGRHHTLFEMLGNFSFGDYFKREAVEWAWEFSMDVLKLDPDRIWATVHPDDPDSRTLWEGAGLSPDRIRDDPENNWSMGDVGPRGPNTELHFDVDGGGFGRDGCVEYWNLVFPSANRLPDGTDEALDFPCVDTGMGLERIAAALRGEVDNYANDLLGKLSKAVRGIAGIGDGGEHADAVRVVVDHSRAIAFLAAQGIVPGNKEREYVMRRILRRTMCFGMELGVERGMAAAMIPHVANCMGDAYPELRREKWAAVEICEEEERRFGKTLRAGLGMLNRETENIPPGGIVPGELVFRLHDTHGFPAPLTRDVALGRGLLVDLDEFDSRLEEQKERSRADRRARSAA